MRGESELYRDKIEVSLDGRQVFYLFFGGAVIASMVFVLGVMVGRRLESRDHVQAAAATSNDPLAALDMLAAGGNDDLSFPDELSGDMPDAPTTPGVSASVPSDETASVDKAAEKAKAEKAMAEKAAAEKAAADKAAADKALTAKAAAEKAKAEKAAAEKAKADARRLASEKAKAAVAAKAKATATKPTGRFTLQLSSFQSEGEADAFYDQLRSAGYRPYVVRAEVPDKGTWYRVRLGKYPTYDAAVAAKGNFEKRQKIIAYVTRIPGR